MKNLKFILTVIGLSLFSIGCEIEEFLERRPLSEIDPSQFFNTENELNLYVNSFYSMVPSRDDLYLEDVDNVVKDVISELQRGDRVVPTSGGGWNWSDLRNINYFLENYDKTLDESIASRYAAVARFFRAWFYFEKVKRFGDVPWYSSVVEIDEEEELQKGRDPRTLVMDSVLADINYAIENLSAEQDVEKITKWTALALKSRICLFEGTFRKYHTEFSLPNSDLFLREAAEASEELIDNSSYSIYTSTPEQAYLELFASNHAIEQEVILTRRFTGDVQVYHNANYYTLTGSWNKPGLEKKLINSYLMADGSRFTDLSNYNEIQFYEETQNRDPRLSQTIRTPGYTRIGSNEELVPLYGNSVTLYQPIKFVTGPAEDGFYRNTNDLPVFRYAEVLLNFAEAKAELGEITQGDIDKSIKLLRDRVGMPNLDLQYANGNPDPYLASQYDQVSGSNQGVILEIRRERRIELVMEGFRWDDLIRWKEGSLLMEQFKGMYFPGLGEYDLDRDGKIDIVIYEGEKPSGEGQKLKLDSEIVLENGSDGGLILIGPNIPKSFDETRDYLYPIPIQELLLNNNLTQNPGWTGI